MRLRIVREARQRQARERAEEGRGPLHPQGRRSHALLRCGCVGRMVWAFSTDSEARRDRDSRGGRVHGVPRDGSLVRAGTPRARTLGDPRVRGAAGRDDGTLHQQGNGRTRARADGHPSLRLLFTLTVLGFFLAPLVGLMLLSALRDADAYGRAAHERECELLEAELG